MRRAPLLAVASVVVLLVAFPGVAAAESRTGGSIVVGANETIDEDLEAVGGSVVVRGTVEGDLQATGGSVLVAGTVGGDVEVSGGSVTISGDVGGDVEAGGGAVELTEDGRIDGTLDAGADNVTINGTVGDDATVGAEEIYLGSEAVIQGDFTYDGNLTRAEGATVEGEVVETDDDVDVTVGLPSPLPDVPGPALGVYGGLVNLLVGAVLLVAFPRFSAAVADRVGTEPVRTGAYGLAVGVGVPVALVVVAITIVGIPLSLAGGLLFAVVAWVGAVYGRYAVGAWLLSRTDVEHRWLALLVGVVAVGALGFVPFVGDLVQVVVFLIGFGALVLELWQRYRTRGDEAGPAPAVDAEPA